MTDIQTGLERPTVNDATESLTGWEEINIARAFGKDVTDLPPLATLRALLYVLKMRAGDDSKTAHRAALDATVREVNAHFADDDETAAQDAEGNDDKAG